MVLGSAGDMVVWLLDAALNVVAVQVYGPFPGWEAKAVAGYNSTRTLVLWRLPSVVPLGIDAGRAQVFGQVLSAGDAGGPPVAAVWVLDPALNIETGWVFSP